ncbi:MAG: hypothetical protein ACK55I_10875, partial [bacterium]
MTCRAGHRRSLGGRSILNVRPMLAVSDETRASTPHPRMQCAPIRHGGYPPCSRGPSSGAVAPRRRFRATRAGAVAATPAAILWPPITSPSRCVPMRRGPIA